jgi:hypothetical protein
MEAVGAPLAAGQTNGQWPSTLDTNKWNSGIFANAFGYFSPQWGSTSGCGVQNGAGPNVGHSTAVPLSSWTEGVGCTTVANGSYEYAPYYDWPYLAGSTNAPGLTTPALSLATDGSLQLVWQQNTFYSPNSGIKPQILSADVSPKQIIPRTGGLIQFRFREEGTLYGSNAVVQCGANDSTWFSNNFLMETGFTEGGVNPLYDVKFGIDNDVSVFAHVSLSGSNITNFHIIAFEYEGDSTRNVNYYFDGVKVGTFTKYESGEDFTCEIGFDVMAPIGSGFHSVPDLVNHPGPFHMWVSDVQIYKKPGT